MKLDPSSVRAAAATSLQILRNHSYQAEDQFGWHQKMGSLKTGNVATSQALLCFHYWSEHCSNMKEAIELVKRSQLRSPEASLDGGWTFVTNAKKVPTVEATAWTLWGLLQHESQAQGEIVAGLQWLEKNRSRNSEGAWGPTALDSGRIYSTSLAMRVLSAAGKQRTLQPSVKWLLDARNSDGGWGPTPSRSSTPIHTAHAVLALQSSQSRSCSVEIASGLSYLESRYADKASWEGKDAHELAEDLEVKAEIGGKCVEDGRVSFLHFPNPWVIVALVSCGRVLSPVVFAGAKWILASRTDGIWRHPMQADNAKPLWALHDCIFALRVLDSAIGRLGTVSSVHLFGRTAILRMERPPTKETIFGWISKRNYGLKILLLLIGVVAAIIVWLQTWSYRSWVLGVLMTYILGVIVNLLTPSKK